MSEQINLFGMDDTPVKNRSNRPKKSSKTQKNQLSKDVDTSGIGLNANWKNFDKILENRGNKTP